jgi:phosphoribosylformylglycinamidine synthase
MAGLIEKAEHITTQWFQHETDAIILLGNIVDAQDPLQGLGGSAYLQRVHRLKTGRPPRCDLEHETNLALGLRALIQSGVVKSAHDCSEGGLAVAIAESCLSQQIARETPRLIGAEIDLSAFLTAPEPGSVSSGTERSIPALPRLDALLFGETQGRVLITVAALDAVKVIERAKLLGLSASRLGSVGGDSLLIKLGTSDLKWSVTELYDLWWNSIAKIMR